jgi:hypothetical protein
MLGQAKMVEEMGGEGWWQHLLPCSACTGHRGQDARKVADARNQSAGAGGQFEARGQRHDLSRSDMRVEARKCKRRQWCGQMGR